MFVIYKITNIINSKVYIGSSSNYIRRKDLHKSSLKSNTHHSRHLQNSFNKYGEEKFKFKIIQTVRNKKELIIAEQLWMEFYNSYDIKFGYNIRPLADTNLGIKRSKEQKEKLSRIAKNRPPVSIEVLKKLSKAQFRLWKNPDHRKMMTNKRKISCNTEQFKRKQTQRYTKSFAVYKDKKLIKIFDSKVKCAAYFSTTVYVISYVMRFRQNIPLKRGNLKNYLFKEL